MKKQLLSAGISILLANSVFAIQPTENNFKFSIGHGPSTHTNSLSGFVDSDGETKAYNVNFSYLYSSYLTLDLGYIDFGKSDNQNSNPFARDYTPVYTGTINNSTEASGFTLSGSITSGNYFKDFQLFARAGIIQWDLEQTIAGPIDSINDGTIFYSGSYQNTGSDPFYSIGFNYSLSRNLLLGLNHQRYDMNYSDRVAVSLAEQGAVLEGQQQFSQNLDITAFELSYIF